MWCTRIFRNVFEVSVFMSIARMLVLSSEVKLDTGRNIPCPEGTTFSPNGAVGGSCKKNCSGAELDNIGTARSLEGCTRIMGALKININVGSSDLPPFLMDELKKYLGKVEEIDDYLDVTYTNSIQSLEFLEKLEIIRGNVLEENKYAIIVMSNQNITELFGSGKKVIIQNANATVFFHKNPKLCRLKIWDFVKKAGLSPRHIDHILDVGISNGNKVYCKPANLKVKFRGRSSSTATIQWENYRRRVTNSSNLLKYEIHYKKVDQFRFHNENNETKDPSGWSIQEEMKMSDDEVRRNELRWELPRSISNLVPYTRYQVYIKTVLTSDAHLLDNDFEAESGIIVFRTLADMPSSPMNLKLVAYLPDKVNVSWEPPVKPNGVLSKFRILIKSPPSLIPQRDVTEDNYCTVGRVDQPLSQVNGSISSDYANDEIRSYGFVSVDPRLKKYELILKNMSFDTPFQIGVQACREVDPDISGGDTRTCSEITSAPVPTTLNSNAVEIESKTISVSLTDINQVQIRWGEPTHLNLNATVIAYIIKIQKVASNSSTNEDWHPLNICVDRKAFIRTGRKYTLSSKLSPGNYSLKIQVISLDQLSEFGDEQVFYIPEDDIAEADTSSVIFWVVLILVPILLIIIALSGYSIYLKVSEQRWSRNGANWQLVSTSSGVVSSVNPVYLPCVDIPETWEISPSKVKLQLKSLLGHGSFGCVYQGTVWLTLKGGETKVPCAVKTVADQIPEEEKSRFLKEAAIMTKLNCFHVVKLLGVVSKTQPIYVIMELMSLNDLRRFLRSLGPGEGSLAPNEMQTLLMAAQIADGMAYIHASRFLHRDLAARNCLVHLTEQNSLVVKIGDFGMSREVTSFDYCRRQSRGRLPIRWMAPESLVDGVFTKESDIWSYGIVLWEIATLASKPYEGMNHDQVFQFVRSGGALPRPDNCGEFFYQLMTHCWQCDPRDRPTFIDILVRLETVLDQTFHQVSFYHSLSGIAHRAWLSKSVSNGRS